MVGVHLRRSKCGLLFGSIARKEGLGEQERHCRSEVDGGTCSDGCGVPLHALRASIVLEPGCAEHNVTLGRKARKALPLLVTVRVFRYESET